MTEVNIKISGTAHIRLKDANEDQVLRLIRIGMAHGWDTDVSVDDEGYEITVRYASPRAVAGVNELLTEARRFRGG
ncbi:hypothetical protein [Streptomyces sp. KR80]|uniref:hypothetical protein n=1 Tax=Streptomyces sp. KR80 TaxID=3457426 RepID=UPI003FD18816